MTKNAHRHILTLRAGNTTTEQRLGAEGRGTYLGASRTSTEHGKLQAAQPESGCSTKAKAQRESRRRQGIGWNGEVMKEILLTKGLKAIVDDDDFDVLSDSKWRAMRNHNTHYAVTGGKGNFRYMHRLLCNACDGLVVDHINGDGLDNRKENLRAVTLSINRLSSKPSKNNTSGFRGVVFEKRTGKWTASVTRRIGGKRKRFHLGTFKSPDEAHAAYLLFIKENYGELFLRTA